MNKDVPIQDTLDRLSRVIHRELGTRNAFIDRLCNQVEAWALVVPSGTDVKSALLLAEEARRLCCPWE